MNKKLKKKTDKERKLVKLPTSWQDIGNMKTKEYTTTEFYNNPSKAVSFVREGGTVYLGYKRLKEPIAVLTSYKDYKKRLH